MDEEVKLYGLKIDTCEAYDRIKDGRMGKFLDAVDPVGVHQSMTEAYQLLLFRCVKERDEARTKAHENGLTSAEAEERPVYVEKEWAQRYLKRKA